MKDVLRDHRAVMHGRLPRLRPNGPPARIFRRGAKRGFLARDAASADGADGFDRPESTPGRPDVGYGRVSSTILINIGFKYGFFENLT